MNHPLKKMPDESGIGRKLPWTAKKSIFSRLCTLYSLDQKTSVKFYRGGHYFPPQPSKNNRGQYPPLTPGSQRSVSKVNTPLDMTNFQQICLVHSKIQPQFQHSQSIATRYQQTLKEKCWQLAQFS